MAGTKRLQLRMTATGPTADLAAVARARTVFNTADEVMRTPGQAA